MSDEISARLISGDNFLSRQKDEEISFDDAMRYANKAIDGLEKPGESNASLLDHAKIKHDKTADEIINEIIMDETLRQARQNTDRMKEIFSDT